MSQFMMITIIYIVALSSTTIIVLCKPQTTIANSSISTSSEAVRTSLGSLQIGSLPYLDYPYYYPSNLTAKLLQREMQERSRGLWRMLGLGVAPQDFRPPPNIETGRRGGLSSLAGSSGNQQTTSSASSCSKCLKPGMFQCAKDCVCIDAEYRCDGQVDCNYSEDEANCDHEKNHDHKLFKCDQNFTLCPKTKKCISRDWLCDGDDDCGDFSDETRCGIQLNCSTDQFQCDNGLCIPKLWVCDYDDDCRDDSDEANCTKIGCSPSEFECSDHVCISINWKCDRWFDCLDESDEKECDIIPIHCNEGEYQCRNRKCIKNEFLCDGDDDCDDWSDEDDCVKNIGECVLGEFKCKDGNCIPLRWRCDNQKDCSGEDDEENCEDSINQNCKTDEHICPDGECILKQWVCDGLNDCTNGEDELNCNVSCSDAEFPCTGPILNDTNVVYCIPRKHTCDGRKNCPKGDDEENCPSSRDCDSNTKCEQLCVTYPGGKKGCSCQNGYKLDKNGFTCNDINECLYATDPVCSQTCENTIGSFKCSCMTGYVLRPDLRTCKAVGAAPTLIFANRVDIRQMTLSSSRYSLILKGLHNVISLDYHYNKEYIFWSDVSTNKIKRAAINGTGTTTIVKSGLDSPGGIAIDWIHNHIYWTDSGTKRVEVAGLDGTHRAIIAAIDLNKPRAIAVHPGECFVFWTDWGPNRKIERAEMDGSKRISIITQSVIWPNGLTIDYTSNQLYWADAKHNVIETASLDGSKRKKVITKGLPHPFAITIFEDAIFWTDWHTKSIATANKLTGAGYKALHSNLYFPMDIHAYHPQRQPKFKNKCGKMNGGCENLCLPNRKSYTCVCRLGQKLNTADNKTCLKPDKFIIFTKKKDLRIKHLDGSMQKQEMVIPLENVKNAAALDWDYPSNLIYWTDLGMKTINRALWNGSDHKIILHKNIVAPKGLAYDWVTDKIFWTDFETSRIEVANSNGSMRSLLIWDNLDKPGDITVNPLLGLMFWTTLGKTKQIEKAFMDGTNRVVLVGNNISSPAGLCVDFHSKNLYWTDGDLHAISFININGTGRRTILSGSSLPYPYGLDIFNNYIFWTDWMTKSIHKAHKISGENRTLLVENVPDSMEIKIFHKGRMTINNDCRRKPCSHLCLLRPEGHSSCACPTGIKINNDKKTCSDGPLNYLILAHRMDIRQISLDVPYRVDVVLPLDKLKMATSVDVDTKTGMIYWADTSEDSIERSYPNGTNRGIVIIHEIETPEGIAIDSTGRKIYWTDVGRHSIEVAELDGSNRKLLFKENIVNPRAIALHYHHGLMFWSDWGGDNPKIEIAHMDGTNRRILISENITWPNGLAIDRPAGRLYWNDAKGKNIESCDLDGKHRKVIVKNVPHPYGLVVVGDHIYWTDWNTEALHRADKLDGTDSTIIRKGLKGLMDVRSAQLENIAQNACGDNNGGCSHLCLRNPTGFTCACPTGLSQSRSHPNQCNLIPESFILTSVRYSISQISLDTDDGWDITLPIKDDMQNVNDIDFHYKKKMIFYSDVGRNAIISVNMKNLSDVRTIVSRNISSPYDIAVDWLADNIYWTNTGHKSIEVARLDGSNRKTIHSDLVDPRSIVVNPKAGHIYWSEWDTNNPTIERSHLDGSNRKTIIGTELSAPMGLLIDFSLRRLYWIDIKTNMERIECSQYNGEHRVTLPSERSHPFSLAQYAEWIFWTEWQGTIMRAEKISFSNKILVRPMHAALGITVVAPERQPYWNPCAVDNGNCTHLCFYKKSGYTCGCPDETGPSECKTTPLRRVSTVCPKHIKKYECPHVGEFDYPDDDIPIYHNTHSEELPSVNNNNSSFYFMTLIPMSGVILISVLIVLFMLIQKTRKKYLYDTSGRSFSNPNYYSNNDPNNPGHQNHPDRKQFIWKRLKYHKSQERVYEETVVANPEVTSLIPTILTPCSSNCEVVTPDLERSPSVTPLHKADIH